MLKIACLVSNRCSYYRQQVLLDRINNRYQLTLLVTGAILSKEHNETLREIEENYLNVKLDIGRYEGTRESMAIVASRLTREATKALTLIKPDCVIVIADRFEVLPVAMAAKYLGLPVCHIQGGEHSGNIDDYVRHATSMLSDIHFVSHYKAANDLMMKGLNNIYPYGCPSLDIIKLVNIKRKKPEDYIIGIFHPHTEEIKSVAVQSRRVYSQAKKFCEINNQKLIWFGPNNDPGFLDVENIEFVDNIAGLEFLILLSKARMIVGNSSCGLRECSYLGVPAVNVGKRQKNRVHAGNVLNCDFDNVYITMSEAFNFKPKISELFGNGDASTKIIDTLKEFIDGRKKRINSKK